MKALTSGIGLVITCGILALVAGLGVGLIARSPTPGSPAAKSGPSASKTIKVPVTPPAVVGREQAAGVPTPEDGPEEIARQIWDLLPVSSGTNAPRLARAPDQWRMALRKLRPEMASLFVRKFRECNPNDERRQYSLELAMACGGPDAADLFLQLATDRADRTSRHYSKIAAETLAYGHLARRPREFPVNDGLLGWMRAAATSEDRDDRILALAVAGFADGSVAMPLLNHSAFNDPDPGVREAGLRELGRRGDATTLVYLRTNLEALAASHQKLYKPVSSGDTVMLMAPDRAEKVIKDAIEELEDRLQPK